ncbi:Vacuolar protein-sorting-associated protein 36 [Coemansia sp. RSA 564]|nr:Vacuolar protein-sorting-associated protein 36 [Coemansia sp. RSA 1824]KAJ2148915.1 Vacuolar protein-sorting-associated protein 36 [Coemansia sp. RSA 564]
MEAADLAPTLRPLLAGGEKISCVQNKVGLYRGTVRDEEHDNDQQQPRERSVALHLSLVDRCSLHSGFLYSSGKIHIYIKPRDSAGDQLTPGSAAATASGRAVDRTANGGTDPNASLHEWQCQICEYVNRGSAKCTLCGVPRPDNAHDIGNVHSSNSALIEGDDHSIRCPVCTFDNHASLASCEMCDSELQPRVPDQPASAEVVNLIEPVRRESSDEGNVAELIKLSFRAGGSSQFYSALREALGGSAWTSLGTTAFGGVQNSLQAPSAALTLHRERRPTTGGISSIVSTAHETERVRDETLQSAFLDLDALTTMANEMVGMAEHIATQLNSQAASKLRRQGGETDDDNAERADAFRQYLLDLGIDSPVTRDTAGAVFHEELARELCDYLENYVSQSGGTVALVDAYCLYNRAREFSLVYPADFVQACDKFEQLGLSLRLRKYPSGLLAIEDPSSASDALIISRINSYIQNFGPVTANELSALEDCPLTLAEERLWICERAGRICRDESVEGVRFYLNRLVQSSAT